MKFSAPKAPPGKKKRHTPGKDRPYVRYWIQLRKGPFSILCFVGFLFVYKLISFFYLDPSQIFQKEIKPISSDQLVEGVICLDVINGKPKGKISKPIKSPGRLFCFTKIRTERNAEIYHLWYEGNQLRSRITIAITKEQTAYSSISLGDNPRGHWSVDVLTRDQKLLGTIPFVISG